MEGKQAMHKILSATILSSVLLISAAPAFAQGGAATPQTAADCKAGETFNADKKLCEKR